MSTSHPVTGWRRLLRPRSRSLRRLERTLLAVVFLLLVLRMTAPWLLQKAINDRLATVPEYGGRVGDIDLALWKGGYAIDAIEIFKREGDSQLPFFAAEHIAFSLAWSELFRGRVVSHIQGRGVDLTLVRAETETGSQLDTDRRWQDLLQDLFPIEIQHLQIESGRLRFVDRTQQPEVDIAVNHLNLDATGLQNRPSPDGEYLPATIVLSGLTRGDGLLTFTGKMSLLAPQPVFDINVALRDVELTAFNDFLRAYANVDVSEGTFSVYLETSGRDGRFEGYVKPFFEDLDFENLSDRERSLPSRIWESIVAGVNSLVKNKPRDQLGTRVPFRGTFAGTEVGTFTAVLNAIRHGFGAAFSESLEGDITPEDVATE